tara:strand:+ start:121 stop:297 length:177 start_codon:yes stop_codon:yes gene_type:complete
MTASEEIKELGLKSTQYVADNSETDRKTLERWHKTKYKRFLCVVLGVKAYNELNGVGK